MFDEPTTLEEAEATMDLLIGEIQSIQTQLSDRNRIDPATGERVTGEVYWTWRRGAIHAWQKKMAQYRQVKQMVKETRREVYKNPGLPLDDQGSDLLLFELRGLLLRVAKVTGYSFSPEDQVVLDRVRAQLFQSES